ncbi:DEAD/DEAH box helicase [Haloimpatiens massiliensis]|uniref:DEAD/DEAH box helicase n=1 Tax=Haloimpatiens massiliensis TaxID=1658110 RepID=UPI0011AF70E6|nr:DEAD/DEAH box helicase [Haloimpatiens massiliensis]
MINFSKEDLKNLCYSSTFQRGKEYYEENRISNFSIEDIEDDYGNPCQRIFANVKGSNHKTYNCIAVLLKKHEEKLNLSSCFCNCEAFTKYEGLCKHTVALLLKYIDISNTKKNKRKINTESIDIASFVNSIRHELDYINSYKKELQLDIILNVDKYSYHPDEYSIELKIGEHKKYVVKNMKQFIEAVNSSETLEFGKGFTYDPHCHIFKSEDKKIIGLIQEIYETQASISLDLSYYNNSIKFFKGKQVSLNELQFKRLLSYLDNHIFTFKFSNKTFENVTIVHENLPIELQISGNHKNILLLQKNPPFLPITSDGKYFLCRDKIYAPSKTQISHYIPFHNKFLKKNPIVIPRSSWGDFSEYIIPFVKNITSTIQIKDEIKEYILKEPLESNIYLDKVDNHIIANLEFKYGKHKINPLNEKNSSEIIIIREKETELEILNTLKKHGFQKEDTFLILKDEEAIVDFLYKGIGSLQNTSNLFYSDNFKNMKVHSSSSIKSSLRINDDDLLEISFNMDNIDNNELVDIFNSIRTKKNYHKLKNGSFVLLNSLALEDFTNTIDYLGIKNSQLSSEKILLSKYNALYLDQKFKDNEIVEVEKNNKFRETINNIKEVHESDFKAPSHIQNILRDYQKTGLKWLKTLAHYGFGGILADEMGLGKTLEAIAFIASREDYDRVNPSLVVCPTSLMYNWESEIQKFAPELKVEVICGNKDLRYEKMKNIKNVDVVITSYPLIRIDIDEYKDIAFNYCFLDEAQAIKNPHSQSAHAVKDLKAKGRFALTGTPIENSLTELWSIFDFIMPGYLLNHTKFRTLYENPVVKNKNEKALKELNNHIKPFILRRHKNDVIKELPKKIEHTVIVDLCDEQKKLYTSYVNSFKNEIDEDINEMGFNKSKFKILSLLTRLRQICCDPAIFVQDYKGESSKVTALLDILDNVLEEGHRVLVFSQFTSMLKSIAEELKNQNINYMYLDGSVKSEDRINMVNKFNEGNSSVFLISLKAGGTGLNLTGADTVIHFDPWWNPSVENQASDRAHRIGQKKTVEVIKLVAKGTIEEKIQKIQEKKKDIFNMTIENASDVNVLGKMSEEEIKELFQI